MHLDWDHVRARDIFVLLASCTPPAGHIDTVAIYQSEFGREHMRLESEFGPLPLTADNTTRNADGNSGNSDDNEQSESEQPETGQLSEDEQPSEDEQDSVSEESEQEQVEAAENDDSENEGETGDNESDVAGSDRDTDKEKKINKQNKEPENSDDDESDILSVASVDLIPKLKEFRSEMPENSSQDVGLFLYYQRHILVNTEIIRIKYVFSFDSTFFD